MVTVSVIIPTHNRSPILRQTLDALCHQQYPADRFEVIVVADGCSDDTIPVVHAYPAPYPLLACEIAKSGAAMARNVGASQAQGELLIFLDDDIAAQPALIQAHVQAHQEGPQRVVIGYLPVKLTEQRDFFSLELQGWWEAMFELMLRPEHRFMYTDLLSGNFSLQKNFFTRLGGFDTTYPVHEDYELGLRLIMAGATFNYEPNAMGIHDERTNLEGSCKRKYQEGIADVMLGIRYPEIRSTLLVAKLHKYSLLPSRLLRILAFEAPGMGDWLIARLTHLLQPLENIHLLGTWRRILYGILGYWYWKGVQQQLSTLKEVRSFISVDAERGATEEQTELDRIDLSSGIEQAEQILDQKRPEGVRIFYGKEYVGTIDPQPGAERLHGALLRPILVYTLAFPLLKTLALSDVPDFPFKADQPTGIPSDNVA